MLTIFNEFLKMSSRQSLVYQFYIGKCNRLLSSSLHTRGFFLFKVISDDKSDRHSDRQKLMWIWTTHSSL